MHRPFAPAPRPPALDELLGELDSERFDAAFHRLCELVDRYAVDLSLEIVAGLGLEGTLADGATLDELLAEHSLAGGFRPALGSLLSRLAQAGEIERRNGTPPSYRLAGRWRTSDRGELRAEALALDPDSRATLDLFEAAAAAHPEVAAGRVSGEQILLAPNRVQLWLDYFSSRNRVYSVSNEIAATAAANRLRPGGGLRILEIGGGAGSAAGALLEELRRRGRLEDLAHYAFTEPSPFFRRRGERELRQRFPTVPLTGASFDIDLPAEGQGQPADFDLVFGVNVVHVAKHLATTLRELGSRLAADGLLVAGECCRLTPDQVVPADLVFELFRGFTSVELDDTRPRHGFLTPEEWCRALAGAGFADVELVPDLARVREVYPRFFAGAVCGRRRNVE